jgi:DNA-binding NarL/FixJ family response regulator
MKNVRILLADDHEIVRHGLRRLLETQPGWKICGEAGSGLEALEKTRQLKPDIVILDHSMPGLSGAEAARQILKALPQTEIVILTMHDSEQLLREVMEAGVHGYVLKSDAMCDMVSAIQALLDHKRYLSPGASGVAVESFLHPSAEIESGRLTPREREIVQLLLRGRAIKKWVQL